MACTMRELVIESLIRDLPDQCEWGSALSRYPEVHGEDGFINYKEFPEDLLYTLSNELLLELLDCNACLRYR